MTNKHETGLSTKPRVETGRPSGSQRVAVTCKTMGLLIGVGALLATSQLGAANAESAAQSGQTKAMTTLAKNALASALSLAPTASTNGATSEAERVIAQIDAGLLQVKAEITTVVERMKAAEKATGVDYALTITNVATAIRKMAQSDLGNNSPMATEAERLSQSFEALVQEGNAGMTNTAAPGAEVYAIHIGSFRTTLALLRDKHASVENVRKDLLERAAALEGKAKAISWLIRGQQLQAAAQEYCRVVDEAVAYAQQLGVLVNQMGGMAPPVS